MTKEIRNADYEVFLTNGAHGYLEHAGTALGHHVTADAQRGDMERCHRMEVRETRSGFEIQKASFERAVDWTEWRETGRERHGVYQPKRNMGGNWALSSARPSRLLPQ